VDSIGVVVVDALSEKTSKVFLVQNDHVIESFSSSTPDPSLGNSILPRASKGRPSRQSPNVLDRFGDLFGENGIVVVDEESWRGVIRECFAKMLDYPGRCRMFGDAEINDLPTTVADHEPRVQELEPSGGDDQEVHRGDTMLVVSKKRFPALALIMVRLSIWEISRDCGEANRNPKLRKFSSDLSSAPRIGVLSCVFRTTDTRSSDK
jgi:hypothetical protein